MPTAKSGRMLGLPVLHFGVRGARVALAVVFVAGLAMEADLRTIWLGRNLVSAACGIFAGLSVYEPLEHARVPAQRARLYSSAATIAAVGAVLVFPAIAPRIGYPMRSLYEACTFALAAAALLVVDRLRHDAVR